MPLLDLFWTMLWLFLFIAWISLLISLYRDIFRRDMPGITKAVWVFVLIMIPLLGSLIYLIANGSDMAQRQMKDVQAMQTAQEDYIRNVAGGGGGASTADELTKLASLRDSGTITADEFAAQKAKMLA